MPTTNFPNGITNVGPGNPLAAAGFLDPTKFHVFFTDFDFWDSNQWTETATSVGTGTSAVAVLDADDGVLRITTAANENDGLFEEWVSEIFTVESGKQLWIKTRLQVGDAAQSDLIVGLHSTDTTPLDATLRFAFISEMVPRLFSSTLMMTRLMLIHLV